MSSPLTPFRASPLEPKRPTGDHHSFHGTVVRSILGASSGAILADLVCRFAGGSLAASKLFVIFAAAGALAGIALRGRRWMAGLMGGGLGALGTLASGLAAQWAPFSAAVFGAAAAPVLGEGESPRRKVLTGLVAGAFGYAGLHVAAVILQSGLLESLVPGPLAAAGAGATAGLFIGLASAPRYLLKGPDPIEARYEPALQIRDGELHELLERSLAIYRAVRAELEPQRHEADSAALETQVGDQVVRILQIAEHCRRVDGDLSKASMLELEDRIAVLERKASATLDPGARDTYQHALASLEDQRTAVRQLEAGRERVIARLHVNVALLEKLRVSLLQLRSADAERYGAEGSLVAETLEELGREMDATAQAITEVFGRPLPVPPARVLGSSEDPA